MCVCVCVCKRACVCVCNYSENLLLFLLLIINAYLTLYINSLSVSLCLCLSLNLSLPTFVDARLFLVCLSSAPIRASYSASFSFTSTCQLMRGIGVDWFVVARPFAPRLSASFLFSLIRAFYYLLRLDCISIIVFVQALQRLYLH